MSKIIKWVFNSKLTAIARICANKTIINPIRNLNNGLAIISSIIVENFYASTATNLKQNAERTIRENKNITISKAALIGNYIQIKDFPFR